MNRQIVCTDDIVGVEVKNPKSEKLGKIETLMLDKLKGDIAYVVLSFGGFLGMGDKLFAMPWSMFSYDTQQDCFIIHVDKEALQNSPGFDKDNWPDMSSLTWRSKINQYYGTMSRDH